MKLIATLLTAFLTLLAFQASGQTSFTSTKWDNVTNWDKVPRLEDHFWRKRVRHIIDLNEKVNEPMLKTENNIYDEKSKIYNANKDKYEYRSGVVNALMDGYANAMIDGYRPDSLDKPMEFPEFKVVYDKETDAGGGGGTEGFEGDTGGDSEFGEEGDEWGFDDFGDEGGGDSPEDVIPIGPSSEMVFSDILPIIDVIEDRIFDKNKSEMFYDVHYLILWVKGPAAEKPIVAFRYEDVADVILNKCQWKNRFNDAEYKTLKEIFEFRLFNSVILNVSGVSPLSVAEADKRRVQMLEFEHNLWEF